MKNNLIYVAAGVLSLAFVITATAQSIDDVKNACIATPMDEKSQIIVSTFHVSGSGPSIKYGLGNEVSEKVKGHLELVNCFKVYKSVTNFIPQGTRAVIMGNIKDYYTSEGALGAPRINFDIEVRNAVTQKVIATRNIKATGKIYVGSGTNKPLANLWNQVLDEAAIFLYQQLPTINALEQAHETKEKVYDSTLSFQERVKRTNTLDEMKEHADEQRSKNWKTNMQLSEYYNDTLLYKEFPKRPDDQFFEYSINGKKYQFVTNGSDVNKSASIHSYEGIKFSRHGLRIQIEPLMVSCIMTIDMFYPSPFTKVRRFHFGNDSTYDSRVPSSRENVSFQFNVCGGFKDGMIKAVASEKYGLVVSNKPEMSSASNIKGGYVQILHFETGQYGVVEGIFKFTTLPYKDKAGKQIQAMKIEGRFRARGSYRDRT